MISSRFMGFLYVATIIIHRFFSILSYFYEHEPPGVHYVICRKFQQRFTNKYQVLLTVLDNLYMVLLWYMYASSYYSICIFLYNNVDYLCEKFIVILCFSYMVHISNSLVNVTGLASRWSHYENSHVVVDYWGSLTYLLHDNISNPDISFAVMSSIHC